MLLGLIMTNKHEGVGVLQVLNLQHQAAPPEAGQSVQHDHSKVCRQDTHHALNVTVLQIPHPSSLRVAFTTQCHHSTI